MHRGIMVKGFAPCLLDEYHSRLLLVQNYSILHLEPDQPLPYQVKLCSECNKVMYCRNYNAAAAEKEDSGVTE
jgi:hypothetical protein